jgi:hypothetical protein
MHVRFRKTRQGSAVYWAEPKRIRMATQVRIAGLLAACIVSVAGATASAATPAPSPGLMARCAELYRLWWNYDEDPVFLFTGERAQAELALYRCQEGRYEEGIPVLETILRNSRFPVPRA